MLSDWMQDWLNKLLGKFNTKDCNWRKHDCTDIAERIASQLDRQSFDEYKGEMKDYIQKGINERIPICRKESYPFPNTNQIAANAMRNIRDKII